MRSLIRCFAVVAVVFAATFAHAQEKLRVAYNQWAGFSHVFVAQDKGFFKEAGVEVELVPFPGPGDSLAPLVAGHLDVSLTTPDNVILLNATTDAAIGVVYMIDTSDGADAVVAKAGIEKAADLKGKTIAVTLGEVNHLLLLKALQSAGLTEDDVTLVNMNPDEAGAALVAGSVDAGVTWEPWVSKAVEAGGKAIFTSKDAPNILLDVVAVSKATREAKPAAIKALITGLDRGLAFMKDKPEEAHAIAAKWLEVEPADVGAMLDGVKLYTLADNAPLLGTADAPGGIVEPLTAIASFMKAKGKIEKEPDVKAMVDPSLIGK